MGNKKKSEFDPAKYKHLHSNTPMEIWVAEFLSRSDIYLDLADFVGPEGELLTPGSFTSTTLESTFGISRIYNEAHNSAFKPLSTGEKFRVSFGSPVQSLIATNDQEILGKNDRFVRRQDVPARPPR